MNYKKIYETFILKCTDQDLSKEPVESHHITPRSWGGSNEKSNIVDLTLRQHYFAHKLLYKIALNEEDSIRIKKAIYALNIMSNSKKEYYTNSRDYEINRFRWHSNHPMNCSATKQKMMESLKQYRTENGFVEIFCKCGCGVVAGVSKNSDTLRYHAECKPGRKIVGKEMRNCECGCGAGLLVYKNKTTATYVQGHQPRGDSRTRSDNLVKYIVGLSASELRDRMAPTQSPQAKLKKSAGIREGKSSILSMIDHDGSIVKFKSYESEIYTGLIYRNLRYILKNKNGVLSDGRVVTYVYEYTTKHRGRSFCSLS